MSKEFSWDRVIADMKAREEADAQARAAQAANPGGQAPRVLPDAVNQWLDAGDDGAAAPAQDVSHEQALDQWLSQDVATSYSSPEAAEQPAPAMPEPQAEIAPPLAHPLPPAELFGIAARGAGAEASAISIPQAGPSPVGSWSSSPSEVATPFTPSGAEVNAAPTVDDSPGEPWSTATPAEADHNDVSVVDPSPAETVPTSTAEDVVEQPRVVAGPALSWLDEDPDFVPEKWVTDSSIGSGSARESTEEAAEPEDAGSEQVLEAASESAFEVNAFHESHPSVVEAEEPAMSRAHDEQEHQVPSAGAGEAQEGEIPEQPIAEQPLNVEGPGLPQQPKSDDIVEPVEAAPPVYQAGQDTGSAGVSDEAQVGPVINDEAAAFSEPASAAEDSRQAEDTPSVPRYNPAALFVRARAQQQGVPLDQFPPSRVQATPWAADAAAEATQEHAVAEPSQAEASFESNAATQETDLKAHDEVEIEEPQQDVEDEPILEAEEDDFDEAGNEDEDEVDEDTPLSADSSAFAEPEHKGPIEIDIEEARAAWLAAQEQIATNYSPVSHQSPSSLESISWAELRTENEHQAAAENPYRQPEGTVRSEQSAQAAEPAIQVEQAETGHVPVEAERHLEPTSSFTRAYEMLHAQHTAAPTHPAPAPIESTAATEDHVFDASGHRITEWESAEEPLAASEGETSEYTNPDAEVAAQEETKESPEPFIEAPELLSETPELVDETPELVSATSEVVSGTSELTVDADPVENEMADAAAAHEGEPDQETPLQAEATLPPPLFDFGQPNFSTDEDAATLEEEPQLAYLHVASEETAATAVEAQPEPIIELAQTEVEAAQADEDAGQPLQEEVGLEYQVLEPEDAVILAESEEAPLALQQPAAEIEPAQSDVEEEWSHATAQAEATSTHEETEVVAETEFQEPAAEEVAPVAETEGEELEEEVPHPTSDALRLVQCYSAEPLLPQAHAPEQQPATEAKPRNARDKAELQAADLLVAQRLISEEQLLTALAHQQQRQKRLGRILLDMGYISEDRLLKALAAQKGVTAWHLEQEPPAEDALARVSGEICRLYSVLPVKLRGDLLVLAMWNPEDMGAIEVVRNSTGLRIEPVLADEERLVACIERVHGRTLSPGSIDGLVAEAMKGARNDVHRREKAVLTEADTRPVVGLVNQLLSDAIRLGASDLHIEPRADRVDVRYRVDGHLQKVREIPTALMPMLTTRLKIMAELDIVEWRLPQDGRVSVSIDDRTVDLRVSVLPNYHGPRIVLRILDKSVSLKRLEDVGFTPSDLRLFRSLIHKPYGILLVTGPTGSGKTTTLYGALSELRTATNNIMTCEDPVEYDIDGINQSQVNEKVGLTFAAQLRAILRQDPDIILVGEIRDQETANTAIRAALTGHLVMSTLHCNDAPSAVPRLLDMGVDPFLLSTSLIGVMSQRLVRVLCPHCKVQNDATEEEAALLEGSGIARPWHSIGCAHCANTGYRGRTAVHEILPFAPPVSQAVAAHEPMERVRALAAPFGYRPMHERALELVRLGVTSIEEAKRVAFFDYLTEAPGSLRQAA
jgi:type IV pilus assembly protein PilB